MALFQISEPGETAPSKPQAKQLAAGIDLGTTNSLVATVRGAEGIAETLSDGQGEALLPSVVRYLENGKTEVGTSAKKSQLDDIDNTISSAKRLLGRGVGDIKTLGGSLP
ncbi:MAG: Hsp70 family protein, partial [Cocleimonas sp.]